MITQLNDKTTIAIDEPISWSTRKTAIDEPIYWPNRTVYEEINGVIVERPPAITSWENSVTITCESPAIIPHTNHNGLKFMGIFTIVIVLCAAFILWVVK